MTTRGTRGGCWGPKRVAASPCASEASTRRRALIKFLEVNMTPLQTVSALAVSHPLDPAPAEI